MEMVLDVYKHPIDPKNPVICMDESPKQLIADKLHEIANNHMKLRQMLGHGTMDAGYQYELQTLKDNVSLFTPEILDKINQIVVKYGHEIAGKKKTKN